MMLTSEKIYIFIRERNENSYYPRFILLIEKPTFVCVCGCGCACACVYNIRVGLDIKETIKVI